MAHCKQYEELPNDEQVKHIAKVIHALQKSANCFNISQGLIDVGEEEGVFSGVLFGREALMNEPVFASDTKG